jgi:hypothetical protein
MNRIAAALAVDPEVLVRGEVSEQPQLVAQLGDGGAEALVAPRDAILPTALGGDGALMAMAVELTCGEYRAGDQVWLRQMAEEDWPRCINRDVLVPRPGGRFAFGRMIDRQGRRVALFPPGAGQRQVVIDNAAWLAMAEMLVRKL